MVVQAFTYYAGVQIAQTAIFPIPLRLKLYSYTKSCGKCGFLPSFKCFIAPAGLYFKLDISK